MTNNFSFLSITNGLQLFYATQIPLSTKTFESVTLRIFLKYQINNRVVSIHLKWFAYILRLIDFIILTIKYFEVITHSYNKLHNISHQGWLNTVSKRTFTKERLWM